MTVYLVGAGPGDPDLLTVRGARLLAAADVVVVDRLVDHRLLDDVRSEAIVIDVGKAAHEGASAIQQAAINTLLIEHGRAGALVVRLKGGDPYVFGRGAEEVAALQAADVAVEVVPGVTSAIAVPALAGVPVTHRGISSSVTIVSGHSVDDPSMQWQHLAKTGGTLVLMMAVANRARIAERLLAMGLADTTPVAVIERGATPHERRVASTLAELGSVHVVAPAVIVVGPVAELLVPIRSRSGAPSAESGDTPALEFGRSSVGMVNLSRVT